MHGGRPLRELTDAIVADSKINLNGGIDELIVVPDEAAVVCAL